MGASRNQILLEPAFDLTTRADKKNDSAVDLSPMMPTGNHGGYPVNHSSDSQK
jgi:hypothetical protein